uniref:FlgD Ig-like domain-containing protein n=1 Tax=Eiseniibacteriota bacterium TaxID=2212470 RepID=A0A832I127_UNCEI
MTAFMPARRALPQLAPLALALAALLPLLPRAARADWTDAEPRLVVLRDATTRDLREFLGALERAGGHATVVHPPQAAVVHAEAGVLESPALGRWRFDVHAGALSPAELSAVPADASLAAAAWNVSLELRRLPVEFHAPDGGPPDAGPLPKEALQAEPPFRARVSANMPLGAEYYDTSEFFAGTTAVGIWLLTSTTVPYDWTTTEENTSIGGVQTGMQTWALRAGASARLQFWFDVHRDAMVSSAPILSPSSAMSTFVDEALAGAGWPGADAFARCFAYNNALRDSFDTNWGFSIFIADSDPAVNQGLFAGGGYAWGYYGGPWVYMSRYSSWAYNAANYYSAVPMHETGHIFYATDEYDGSLQTSGYLNARDSANVAVQCIMNQNLLTRVCQPSRNQLGWRDLDGNGVMEVLDAEPLCVLDARPPEPSPSPQLSWTGHAAVSTIPNLNPYGRYSPRHAMSVDRIAAVEFRVDGGAWAAAQALDGAFDGYGETFAWQTTLCPGPHAVEVRVSTLFGRVSTAPVMDSVTVSGAIAALSGAVRRADGAGIADVALLGLPGTPHTASGGAWSAALPCGWAGTVTPLSTNYVFTPAERRYASVDSTFLAEDFVAERIVPRTHRFADGADVAWAGDWDRDGFDDALVGSLATGSLALHLGGMAPDTVADCVFEGALAGGRGGLADLDGDGVPELAVALGGGADGHLEIFAAGGTCGDAPWLVLGPDGDGDGFAASLAGSFDFDGDGRADLALGRPGWGAGDAGRAEIHLGGPGMDAAADFVLHSDGGGGDRFGAALAPLADLDGDGRDELLVAADQHGTGGPGYARLVFGEAAGAPRVMRLAGPAPGADFGHVAAAVGDLDGDGAADLAVGAPGANRVLIYRGGAAFDSLPDAEIAPPHGGARFGSALAPLGDIDADGFDDFAIGDPDDGGGTGRIHVVRGGGTLPSTPAFTLVGQAAGEGLGHALARVHRFDGRAGAHLLAGAANGTACLFWFPEGATLAIGDAPRGPAPRRGLALAARPSPAAAVATIECTPTRAGPLRLEVVDVGGRRVRSWSAMAGGLEPVRVEWDGRLEGGPPAPAGLYFIVATHGAERAVARLVRLR